MSGSKACMLFVFRMLRAGVTLRLTLTSPRFTLPRVTPSITPAARTSLLLLVLCRMYTIALELLLLLLLLLLFLLFLLQQLQCSATR
jgi:hypothetical protein